MDKQQKKVVKPTKEELAKMITGEFIDRYLHEGSTKIIKYSELGKYYNDTVEELLPIDNDYRIILIEQNYNSGHWCCIMRYGKTIEWFDPYGIKPPNELNFISTIKNKMLGQNKKTLLNLYHFNLK